MLKIRRPLGRLIFNMGIAIPGKTVSLIETAPCNTARHLITKRYDALPQILLKSRSREIECYGDGIVLKFDRHLANRAGEMPVKFQSDWKYLKTNLAALRLNEILHQDVRPLSE